MRWFIATIASIMMLATTAAFGRNQAAPAGIDKVAAWVSSADQHRIDGKTLNPMLTSGAPVVLTMGRGGGGMHGGGSIHAFNGGGFRGGGLHRDFDRGFHRDFDHRFNRGFDRDDFFRHRHFVPRHRFSDRDDFFFRFNFGWPYAYGYYPYRYYYYPYGYYPYWYPYGYYYPYSYGW